MRFYNQPHRYYCGTDLRARSMFMFLWIGPHAVDRCAAQLAARTSVGPASRAGRTVDRHSARRSILSFLTRRRAARRGFWGAT